MKQLLFLVFFLPIVSYGQFSKGTKFVGGNITYSSSQNVYANHTTPSQSTFSLNAQAGYFVNDSWAVGPVVNFNTRKIPNINPITNVYEDTRVTGMAGGLFARKFFPVSENFFFSLEGKGLVGSVKNNLNSDYSNDNNTRFLLSLRPAFTFMPTSKWGFDASIGEVQYQNNWQAIYYEDKSFHVNLGHVNLGVNYFFGR